MNMNELAKLMCEKEGKKEQVNIAQMKEILNELSIEMWEHPDSLLLMIKNGKRLFEKREG